MANKLDLIDEIISRPSQQYYQTNTNFNSRTLQINWDNAIGLRSYYYGNENRFLSPFFKQFWKVIKHLTGRNSVFKTFIETWYPLCRDHSSTHNKIESCNRLEVNLLQRYGNTDPRPLKNCTRLYYIASGINNIPNTPSDQDTTATTETYVYKAEESHTLQKTLIKLRGGESITTKIFKDKMTEDRIIYYNKYDTLAIAYLQVYAICRSWTPYQILKGEPTPLEITDILNTYAEMLKNYITETTYNEPLKDDTYMLTIHSALKRIEDELLKINQSDDTLEKFANEWQVRLFKTEKEKADKDIDILHQSAKGAMDNYYNYMEQIRAKQKIIRSIIMNDEDAKFLLDYFTLFKTLPGTKFHRQDKKLYCLYEVPFAHSDFGAMKRQIKDIPEDMTPSHSGDWKGSSFAQEVNWAIREGCSDENQGYWCKIRLIKGYKDKEYWPAFIRATKRLLNEIFVDRKTALYLSTCLRWDGEGSSYQANGTNIGNLPIPFQPFIKERMWQPHMTHYDCWGAAKGEITKALSNRDAQTAFEYTISASGQISFPESAGTKITGYIWGNNKGYFNSNAKIAAENLRVYQRLGQTNRETLFELLSLYIREELSAIEPEPIIIPKTEIKKKPDKSIDERLLWLEAHRFVPRPGANITQIASTTDTRFQIHGQTYIFLPSGDFLSTPDYERYRAVFPEAPISAPCTTTTETTTTIQEPAQERPTPIIDPAHLTRQIIPTIDTDIIDGLLADFDNINIALDPLNHMYHLRNNQHHLAILSNHVNLLPDQLQEIIINYAAGHTVDGDNFEIPRTPPTAATARAVTAEATLRELELRHFQDNPTENPRTEGIPPQFNAPFDWLDTIMETPPATPPEPTPLHYINLVRYHNGWRFPRAAELPDQYHEFNEFVPQWNTNAPNPEPQHLVQYDTIEDTVSYETNGTRHIVSRDVLDQLRRRLPF